MNIIEGDLAAKLMRIYDPKVMLTIGISIFILGFLFGAYI